MSFLSGLFGRTKYEPTTRTVQTVSKLPEEIAPYVTDILEDAQAQYDKAVAEGYQPYGKETIAPRTPEEAEAIAGLRSLIGGQGKYIDEAEAALRGIDTEFTAETAQKFMSPYQQAVTDIEKRKAEEDFRRRVMPEFERQAVEAGGMSGLGSRAGVQAALLGEAFSQQLGDIQARGQQKAYEDAYRQFTDQGQRQRMAAEDLRNVGLQRFQTGLAEQGLGQQLAQQDRQEAQNILDKKFLEYLEQEQFPQQKLAEYSGLVYGNPLAKMADTTQTTSGFRAPNAPGIGQQLLGLGLSGLNVFGMGGGFSPGGFSTQNLYSGKFKSPLKTGGRIVYRQEGGEVPNIYNNPQASPAGGGLSQLGSGFLGGLFGRIFRPRQTNVIENIDNAAGSLNDYKEAMDENMLDLRRASAGISRTYNQTFGNPLRFFMEQRRTPIRASQSPGFEQKADTFGMKAGGGLGSLPVIKQQAGTDPRTRNTLEALKLARAQRAPMTPPDELTAREARDISGATQGAYNRALQKYGDQFKGVNFSLGPKKPMSLKGLPAIPNLRSKLISNVPDQAGTATSQIDMSGGLPSLTSPKDETNKTGMPESVANLIRERALNARTRDQIEKEIMDEVGKLDIFNVDKQRKRNEQTEADLKAEYDYADDALEKINIEGKEASDKFLADQKKSIEEMGGYPGGIIADAIEAGLERPSLVTMLTTVFNKTAKGLTERSKEISKELRDLSKVEFDLGKEERAKKRQTLEKKSDRKIKTILRKAGFDKEMDQLSLKQLKFVTNRIKSISQQEDGDIDRYLKLMKILADAKKGSKGSTGKSVISYIDRIEKDVARSMQFLYDDKTGTIMVDKDNPLSKEQRDKLNAEVNRRKRDFNTILKAIDPTMSDYSAMTQAYATLLNQLGGPERTSPPEAAIKALNNPPENMTQEELIKAFNKKYGPNAASKYLK